MIFLQNNNYQRTARSRDLLHPGRSQSLDRALERGVQSHQTTQGFRVSSPFTTGMAACTTAILVIRSNITTGTYYGGWSRHPFHLLSRQETLLIYAMALEKYCFGKHGYHLMPRAQLIFHLAKMLNYYVNESLVRYLRN